MGDDERKPKDRGDAVEVKPAIPKNREEVLKWNGWGYKDSKFFIRGDNIYFTGSRYPISNGKLPHFADWAKSTFGINLTDETEPIPEPPDSSYPSPRLPATTLQRLRALSIPLSTRNLDRLFRAHGHTLHDIYTLRTAGVFERIPDVVVWPRCHDEVVDVVELADELGLVVIPFGGGTAVSGAAECPQGEERTIVSLDTTQMNRLLWVDKENLLVCCESGIVGQDLERVLKGMGYTVGHEPDSYEFSSLGGWVATRASGMKKNTYGNIEDLVVHVKMVTPKGVLTKSNNAPRISCGPDFNHVILGSEGSLGVITEVVLKMRPLPACRKYGSVVFPNFELGVACMREIAKQRCQPASVRLMDNEQFKFGHALKPEKGYFGQILDGISKLYVTKIKGFDVDSLCAMTLLFEGDKTEVSTQEKRIYKIASDFGGFPGGATNGERGYALTFVIAYIRDLAFRFDIVSESFETSVPWDRVLSLCRNVKHCVRKECKSRSISHHLICCRVTQTYDAGCVVYFYFAFAAAGLRKPVKVYESIEEKARDEIIANGGSISHHHGVGKLRRKWYAATVSDVGVGLYVAAKRELDPNDVFATGNLVRAKL